MVATYQEPTRVMRRGTNAYLVRAPRRGGYATLEVVARSRSGRWVRRFERRRRLGDFRLTDAVPTSPHAGAIARHDGWTGPLLVAALRAP